MESDISILQLILDASLTVQFVMLVLLLASMSSWYLIVQRFMVISRAKKAAQSFEADFWSGKDLREIYQLGNERLAANQSLVGMEVIFRAGFKEFNRLRKQGDSNKATSPNHETVLDSVQRSMRIANTKEQERLERHLPYFASVASVSPYIGLFGTVWGIMGSFLGLAGVHQATLATVAPGISEALIATAMGLIAAIPAALAYNQFVTAVDNLANSYTTFAEEFSSVLHRSLSS